MALDKINLLSICYTYIVMHHGNFVSLHVAREKVNHYAKSTFY